MKNVFNNLTIAIVCSASFATASFASEEEPHTCFTTPHTSSKLQEYQDVQAESPQKSLLSPLRYGAQLVWNRPYEVLTLAAFAGMGLYTFYNIEDIERSFFRLSSERID